MMVITLFASPFLSSYSIAYARESVTIPCNVTIADMFLSPYSKRN